MAELLRGVSGAYKDCNDNNIFLGGKLLPLKYSLDRSLHQLYK